MLFYNQCWACDTPQMIISFFLYNQLSMQEAYLNSSVCMCVRQLLCESKARQHCFIAMTPTPPSLLQSAKSRRPRQGCQTTKQCSAKANIQSQASCNNLQEIFISTSTLKKRLSVSLPVALTHIINITQSVNSPESVYSCIPLNREYCGDDRTCFRWQSCSCWSFGSSVTHSRLGKSKW